MHKETENVKLYSPYVIKRLLYYIKPYKAVWTAAVIALFIATAAELYLPVIIKNALDKNLLLKYVLVTDNTNDYKDSVKIKNRIFIPTSSSAEVNHGNLFWYIINQPDKNTVSVINKHPDIFICNQDFSAAAITLENRKNLSTDELKIIRGQDIKKLKIYSALYLTLLAVVLIFTFIQVYFASWTGQKIMADLRNGLMEHVLGQSLNFLSRTPVGKLVSRIANDVETINEFFTEVTISFLKDFTIMAGVVIVMFSLNVKLALISLAALIPTVIIVYLFQEKIREAFRLVRIKLSDVNIFLSEHISGISTIQMFAREKEDISDFTDLNNSLLKAEILQLKTMAFFRPLVQLLSSVSIALIIWYSAGLNKNGMVSLGVLIAFIELISKFFKPIKDIAEKFNILQSAMAGGERLFSMLDISEKIPEEKNISPELSRTLENGLTEINFNNVVFSYVKGEIVLNKIKFNIKKGETVAIVGPTGSGKTTIANLLTRLWDTDEGEITLNGINIKKIPVNMLRNFIQPVQQDVFLFTGTIKENIDLGKNLPEEKITEAAVISQADRFIRKLPDGYSTHVTEGASNLSAGERQLIAFARIIAHNPKVIILDEATANVDTETESLLQEGMKNIFRHRTSLVIAHRLSTIKKADKILVVSHGKIVERGPHEELIKKKGLYYSLYKQQFNTGL